VNNIEPDILKNAEPKAINAVSDEIHFVEAHTSIEQSSKAFITDERFKVRL
jgi:hypothetical protein